MHRFPSWNIRAAALTDVPAILSCLQEAFEPYRALYTPGAFADTVLNPETLALRLATMTILAAETGDGDLAGTIAVGVEFGGEGHLRGMAVRTAWQGSGVASALLAAAESLLAARGCQRVTLDTTAPLTRAIAFYGRHGYRPTDHVQDFFGMPLYEYARILSSR